jgi:hypothetical protein
MVAWNTSSGSTIGHWKYLDNFTVIQRIWVDDFEDHEGNQNISGEGICVEIASYKALS